MQSVTPSPKFNPPMSLSLDYCVDVRPTIDHPSYHLVTKKVIQPLRKSMNQCHYQRKEIVNIQNYHSKVRRKLAKTVLYVCTNTLLKGSAETISDNCLDKVFNIIGYHSPHKTFTHKQLQITFFLNIH